VYSRSAAERIDYLLDFLEWQIEIKFRRGGRVALLDSKG
jgi:hypothetical protein